MSAMPAETVGGVDIFAMADELVAARARKEAAEEALKRANELCESVQGALANAMTASEVANFTRGGRQFYLRTDTYVSTKGGAGRAVVDWLREHGGGDIIQETVHPSTLRAYVKECRGEEGALPDGLGELVNVFDKLTVGIRTHKEADK